MYINDIDHAAFIPMKLPVNLAGIYIKDSYLYERKCRKQNFSRKYLSRETPPRECTNSIFNVKDY